MVIQFIIFSLEVKHRLCLREFFVLKIHIGINREHVEGNYWENSSIFIMGRFETFKSIIFWDKLKLGLIKRAVEVRSWQQVSFLLK